MLRLFQRCRSLRGSNVRNAAVWLDQVPLVVWNLKTGSLGEPEVYYDKEVVQLRTDEFTWYL